MGALREGRHKCHRWELLFIFEIRIENILCFQKNPKQIIFAL